MTVIASGLDSPLLFIDAANVGTAIWTVEKVVPVAELNASVGRDNRPAYMRLSAWQQRVIAVWMLGLVPLLILLVLTWLMAVAPAQQIANYLALLQQGSKVAPLSERKFSGGFKRIVKNLNTVLERKEGRSPQSLAPISQLLQQQAREEISGEFKLDAIDGPTANKQVPPAQLQALRDAADKPMERTEIALPPVQPLQAPREPPTPMKAPLSPLSSGLSALSDSIFEDDKSVTSKLNASDIAELRGAAAQKPIEKPVVFEEMPLPAAAVINPQPNAGISKLESLSDSETESGLGALSEMLPAAPSQRPWPESTATVIAPMPAMPAPAALDPDDAHFQEVFQQFLKVREQCGEPTNNLTYDKFVEKLKKSRDQVMQKQQTRNVRFQVYVKDGKAALKAVAAGRSS